MEAEDYRKRILQTLPGDQAAWCFGQFKREYGIYKQMPNRREVQLICTACGWADNYERVGNEGCGRSIVPYGFSWGGMPTKDGDNICCPFCGAELEVKWSGNISKYGLDENLWFMSFGRLDERFVLYGWRAERNTGRDGSKQFRLWPMEAYVFEEKLTRRLTGYQKFMTTVKYFGHWEQRKQFRDMYGICRKSMWVQGRMPEDKDLTGTTCENSAFGRYLEAAGDRARPVSYLRMWQKHRNLENLVLQGCGDMVARAIDNECRSMECSYGNPSALKMEWIRWKEQRPARMLDLNKVEFQTCVREQWDQEELQKYKMVRAYEPVDLIRDRPLIGDCAAWELRKLSDYWVTPPLIGDMARGKSTIMRCLRYAGKQGQPLRMLVDYWEMAHRERMDLNDEHVRFPKSLQKEHDRLVKLAQERRNAAERARKQKEMDERRGRFTAIAGSLAGLTWERGGIFIRPCRQEEELIAEGQALSHCVGGYGSTIARGESWIFFIRHTDTPEESWYTLQVSINGAEMKQMQNHGKRNILPTAEVDDFVNAWLCWANEHRRARVKTA